MSKFTPGPWRIDSVRYVVALKEKPVCELPQGGIRHGAVDTANANLIAAAPEMWDALQMCKDWLGKDFPQIGHDALAKAEGRQ